MNRVNLTRQHLLRQIMLGLLLVAVLATVSVVSAQVLLYGLDWWTVDSGGGLSQGGDYTLHGGVGQPDAGQSTNGQYTLSGGFWNGGPTAATAYLVYLPMTSK